MDAGSREADTFGGRLRALPLQDLTFSQVLASSHDVYRTAAAISRSRRSSPWYLLTQLACPWSLRQGGQLLHLRPGDAVLVDAGQPTEMHFPQACGLLSIELPRPWLARWLPVTDAGPPRTAWREQGWGRTLSALCLQLGEDPTLAARYPGGLLADHVGALLAASLEPVAPASLGSRDLVARATTLIRQQLDEPGLVAADLAAQLHVSRCAPCTARSAHRA